MAKNCLVKEFKSVFDNNALPYYDKFVLPIRVFDPTGVSNPDNRIRLSAFEGTWVAKLSGDSSQVYFTDSTYTQNLGNTINLTSGNISNLYIVNKSSSVQKIEMPSAALAYIFNSNNQNAIEKSQFTLDALFSCYNMTVFELPEQPGSWSIGDVSKLANKTKLTSITAKQCNITGNIESLSNLTKLNAIYMRFNYELGGNILTLLANLSKNGKIGNLTAEVNGTNIIYTKAESKNLYCTFDSSGVSVYSDSGKTTLVTTYTKSTDTWS